jgi:hypothetical protein
MLVALSGLVMRRIGIDRSGPLMTVVVPWAILQASSKVAAGTGSAQAEPVLAGCASPLGPVVGLGG